MSLLSAKEQESAGTYTCYLALKHIIRENKEVTQLNKGFPLYVNHYKTILEQNFELEKEMRKLEKDIPQLIYGHACDRAKVKSWKKEGNITNGLLENTYKGLAHANVISDLKDTLANSLEEHIEIITSTDSRAERIKLIDERFYELILWIAYELKEIEEEKH